MLIEDNEIDFAEKLSAIYQDTEALTAMSTKALNYIKTNNCIEAVWETIKKDFE